MARTIPAAYNVAEPDLLTSGRIIRAGDLLPLGQDQNRLYAVGRAQPVISQGWATGVAVDNGGVLTQRCTWRIPKISDRHTQTRCIIRGAHTAGGAGARVEFRSVNAGGTCTLDIPGGGVGFYASDGGAIPHLPVSFVAGPAGAPWPYEEIEMWTRSDGSGVRLLDLYAGNVDFVPLSAMAAGAAGDFTPQDDLEWATEEPVASDQLVYTRSNLVDLEIRPRVIANWSQWNGATTWLNVFYERVYVRGNRNRPTEVTYHVRMGDAVDEANLYIQHGAGHAFDDNSRMTHLNVPAGGGVQWVSGTFTLHDGVDLRAPHSLTHVDWTSRANLGSFPQYVYGVSMWAK